MLLRRARWTLVGAAFALGTLGGLVHALRHIGLRLHLCLRKIGLRTLGPALLRAVVALLLLRRTLIAALLVIASLMVASTVALLVAPAVAAVLLIASPVAVAARLAIAPRATVAAATMTLVAVA